MLYSTSNGLTGPFGTVNFENTLSFNKDGYGNDGPFGKVAFPQNDRPLIHVFNPQSSYCGSLKTMPSNIDGCGLGGFMSP